MKVHVWGINYSPEVTGIGPYNVALCEWLARQGHDVRMVTTFCYYPAWRKIHTEERLFSRTDHMDGVTVHRCWHYVPNRVTTFRRMLHEISFVLTSFVRILLLPRPDLIVAVSPPLLLGPAAWLASLFKRTKFVFHVQDLQPGAAASLGMLPENSSFFRFLRAIEVFSYKKAARVSAITPGMLRQIAATGIPPEKTLLFLNGVELPDFWRLPQKMLFRNAHQIAKEDFLVVYSGNIGRKQGLEQIVDAARLLHGKQIRFVICGEGAQRDALKERALGLANVTFLPLLPEARYHELLLDADLCVIPQQAGSGTSFFPSKLLKTLSFSAPVLTVAEGHSELARAVAEGGFGVNIEPNNPEKIAATIGDLSTQPELLHAWGRAGFKFVKRFEQSALLSKFTEELAAVAGEE